MPATTAHYRRHAHGACLGRMLSEQRAPDLPPEEARAAKATAELVVRRVLDWLARYRATQGPEPHKRRNPQLSPGVRGWRRRELKTAQVSGQRPSFIEFSG
jgi:hypothetical protein